jgi:hypothetical protein
MTRKSGIESGEVEAGLDRSLQKHIAVPELGAKFNAAVWARIAAEQARTPARSRAAPVVSRWLLASNIVGILISLALIVYFIARSFSGVEVEVNLDLPLLQVSEGTIAAIVQWSSWVFAIGAVGFGMTYTSFGRRVRNIFR